MTCDGRSRRYSHSAAVVVVMVAEVGVVVLPSLLCWEEFWRSEQAWQPRRNAKLTLVYPLSPAFAQAIPMCTSSAMWLPFLLYWKVANPPDTTTSKTVRSGCTQRQDTKKETWLQHLHAFLILVACTHYPSSRQCYARCARYSCG